MLYKGFYIEITPDEHIIRSDINGNDLVCQGFYFKVFSDENKSEKVDEFTAAVGHEILYNSVEEAEQFAAARQRVRLIWSFHNKGGGTFHRLNSYMRKCCNVHKRKKVKKKAMELKRIWG